MGVGNGAGSEPDRQSCDGSSSIARIRDEALKSFAERGTSGTSLRSVAASAGVSLGLVQHYFSTKAGLIKAVDDYVIELIIRPLSEPISTPPPGESADSIAEIGSRVYRLFIHQPAMAGYLGRALMDGSPLGATIFDELMRTGTTRWRQRIERGEVREDIDLTWAVINSIVLALGTFSLRSHVDRHLPATLTEPAQLQRWQVAVDSLLRDGLSRHLES